MFKSPVRIHSILTSDKNILRFGSIPYFYSTTFHDIGDGSLRAASPDLNSWNKTERLRRKWQIPSFVCESDFREEYSSAMYIFEKKGI